MKKLIIFFFSVVVLFGYEFKDKVFVVERENSALAIIDKGKFVGEIKNMHNFNHAVVKFKDNDGYAITRDGYIIKFDPINNKKLKEYKTSKSAIGFVIGDDFVAVANYDDKSVDILDRDLSPIQKIKTNSRNVGIKIYKDYLVFACMDSDQIWVMKKEVKKEPLKCIGPDGKPMYQKIVSFKKFKVFDNVGEVPFDAMIDRNLYVVGFFNSTNIGVLNLDTFEYKKVFLKVDKKNRILKVPHFGFWSISGDYFFIPAVGDKKVFVFDRKFHLVKAIEVDGNPVFTSLSPNKKYLAVTFSGKDFPKVQIVDTKDLKVLREFKFDGWILHLRWSKSQPVLYFSVNTKDRVDAYDVSKSVDEWSRVGSWKVPRPSGIFIFYKK
ncbi:MAG: nitrite reductase [Epsilonproteobacteria bacterium]|nr:nitrite reductase [Campylobacterota bacterium]